MKWPRAAPKQRKSIAESLANVTAALLATDRGAPTTERSGRPSTTGPSTARGARGTAAGRPGHDGAMAVGQHCQADGLTDAALIRKALDTLALRIDGKAAAANTVARKRAVFYGALRYAVELRLLDAHPMDFVQWVAPKSTEEVDRQICRQPGSGLACSPQSYEVTRTGGVLRLHVLRRTSPAEALHLREEECELPEQGGAFCG